MMSILPLCLFASIALQEPGQQPPKPPEPGSAEPKPQEPKPAEPKAAEPKPSAPKPAEPARNGQESALDKLTAEGWDVADQVGVIVNNEIITLRQVRVEMKRRTDLRPIRKDEVAHLHQQVVFDFANRLLAAQGGQDLGADEKIVDLQVKGWFDNWVESKGGVVAATKLLQSENRTTQEFRRELRQALYGRNWRRWITGEGAGVGTRPYRDRYVRPGMMQFRFENEIQDPARYGDLGGKPETYHLQRILLDPADHGGPEKTQELAEDLRRRLVETGDDMTDLVQKFGSKLEQNKDGVFPDLNAARLKKIFPELAAFADKAQPGDVSSPIALKSEGKTMYQVFRIIEKVPAVKPELSAQAVQLAITKAVEDELDNYLLQRAFQQLYRAAYIWPEVAREPGKP